MTRLFYILSLLLFIQLTSCETELAYNGAGQENFLVLNAIINPDSLFQCHVTRSNSFSEQTPIQRIDDAKVGVYEDGTWIENLKSQGDGFYASPAFKPSTGKQYALKVEHAKFKTITANTIIPEAVEAYISDVHVDEQRYTTEYTVSISDKPGADYYQVLVYRYGMYYDSDGNEINGYILTSIETSDPVLTYNKVVDEDSGFSDYPDNVYNIFNDDLFDGQVYKLKFSIYDYSDHEPIIVFGRLNEDLYLYYSSVQSKDYYEDNPFSEPVRIHSNVKGGAGVLGALSTTILLDTTPVK